MGRGGFEPPKALGQLIYSQSRLTTSVSARPADFTDNGLMSKRRWILWQGLVTPSMERFIASATRSRSSSKMGAAGLLAYLRTVLVTGRPKAGHRTTLLGASTWISSGHPPPTRCRSGASPWRSARPGCHSSLDPVPVPGGRAARSVVRAARPAPLSLPVGALHRRPYSGRRQPGGPVRVNWRRVATSGELTSQSSTPVGRVAGRNR